MCSVLLTFHQVLLFLCSVDGVISESPPIFGSVTVLADCLCFEQSMGLSAKL